MGSCSFLSRGYRVYNYHRPGAVEEVCSTSAEEEKPAGPQGLLLLSCLKKHTQRGENTRA